mmetsp:Transcript_11390/g.28747  ORF Transcript_11390/g.28747 Transcript_11390/m.28747 type:complete len:284 (-) Transcript_11390:211-1062(-)
MWGCTLCWKKCYACQEDFVSDLNRDHLSTVAVASVAGQGPGIGRVVGMMALAPLGLLSGPIGVGAMAFLGMASGQVAGGVAGAAVAHVNHETKCLKCGCHAKHHMYWTYQRGLVERDTRRDKARIVGWERRVYQTDVEQWVRVRFSDIKREQPRAILHIGTGVHGWQNQADLVRRWKEDARRRGGTDEEISSFTPANSLKDWKFVVEDFNALGRDESVILHDLAKPYHQKMFKQALEKPGNYVLFAWCYSSDNPYFKMAEDEDFEKAWRGSGGDGFGESITCD